MPKPDNPESTRPADKLPESKDHETGIEPDLRRDDSATQRDAQRRADDITRLTDSGTLPRVSVVGEDSQIIVRGRRTEHSLIDADPHHEPESVAIRSVLPERAGEIQAQFPAMSLEQQSDARKASDTYMGQIKIRSLDGSTETSVGKLIDNPEIGLTAEHREIIRQAAAEVHAHFKEIGGPYQDANWEHTAEEVGHALKIGKKLNMSSSETLKLVLSSLFSDSVKTPQNFFTHHVDGAVGWNTVADRVLKNLPANERGIIKRDVERAILTHQISPPGFMSNFHARIIREGLKADLDKAATNKELTVDEKSQLNQIKQKIDDPKTQPFSNQEQELLKTVCKGNPELLKLIQDSASIDTLRDKLNNPLDPKYHTQHDGMSILNLDAKETAQLERLGLDRWWVPDPTSPSYKLEIAAIAADGGQYGSLIGKGKYTTLGGPDTPFPMPTLEASWANPEKSAQDVAAMLHEFPELTQLSSEELADTQKVLREKIAPKVRQWVGQQPDVVRNPDGTVPYLDAPLKYPAALNPDQRAELEQLQGKNNLAAAEQTRVYDLTHNGLTPIEAQQYDFARKIKAQAAVIIKEEFHIKENTPQIEATDIGLSLDRSRPRTGARNAGKAEVTDLASEAAPADIKENRGGGFDVVRADQVRPVDMGPGEKLTEERIRVLREQIIGDKNTNADEKSRALAALELALRPEEVGARKAVVEAQREARRGAGEGTEGSAAAIGVVVLALASYYATYRAQHSTSAYIPKAQVN